MAWITIDIVLGDSITRPTTAVPSRRLRSPLSSFCLASLILRSNLRTEAKNQLLLPCRLRDYHPTFHATSVTLIGLGISFSHSNVSAIFCRPARVAVSIRPAPRSVSYTHLDVYKRQFHATSVTLIGLGISFSHSNVSAIFCRPARVAVSIRPAPRLEQLMARSITSTGSPSSELVRP